MLFYRQQIEQNVVLRREAKSLPNDLDVRQDVVAIHVHRAMGRRYETRDDRPGGALPRSIPSEKGGDHISIELHREILQCHFVSVVFREIADFNAELALLVVS